jgi:glycosyltransferase involved in cell wall biosynthesis
MSRKQIAVVEWNWTGHHPGFFAQFVLALEELGIEVLALCPQPEEARRTVAELREHRGLGPLRDGQTAYRRLAIHGKRFLRLRPARISAIDWTLRHFRAIEGLVKKWQAESGKRVDLIFYACIFDWDFDWFDWVRPFLKFRWAGLYMHASGLRLPGQPNPETGRLAHPEKLFHGPLCLGVATLDEGAAPRLAEVTGKPVAIFPDLTDERLPTGPSGRALGNRLRRFANGQPIIGLAGNLVKRKGVLQMAAASRDPRMSEVIFALAGEMGWWSYSLQEKETLLNVLTNGENMLSHLLRIPEEEQLNFLMSALDVVYAAYLDFPHSSNIMVKAALLRKPLIVSDGYLMAERVRRFRMGEVVPQGDVEALVGAIIKITRNPKAWIEENQPRWSDYCREHSFERLKEAFGGLLAKF